MPLYTLKVPRYRFTGRTPATIFYVSSNRPNTGGADNGNRTHIFSLEGCSTNRCAISANVERVIGIEPTSSAWKADALAVVLYPQMIL